ncbi:BLUF domain-containing protein [Mucilaginibacter sp. HMF5004]|uniref:BLUF domain-containing protein n=1 Tax=Mucilaginibacter rivuli TaxID=2857527 RepID=UPI001C5E479E|nr:BLUF domain-containing protein [Mucilaginibacter rivuli]MBW4889160.1 BLUF domain-containing protein [Mucilaginibacter rivuli]
MNYLIYVSTSSRLLNTDDLGQILLEGRKNFNNRGITGMMLYSNGTIFQALEGEAEELDQLFEGIRHDDSQKSIIKLKTGSSVSRTFSDWSVGFKASCTDMVTHVTGFVDPLKHDFLDAYNHQHPAINLLKSFAQYNLQY